MRVNVFAFIYVFLIGCVGAANQERSVTPPPAGLLKQARDGKNILRFERFSLDRSGAAWQTSPNAKSRMDFIRGGDYYRLRLLHGSNYYAEINASGIEIKANRNYTLWALVYYDIPNPKSEIDMGIRFINNELRQCASGNKLYMENNGVMGNSGGWQWWKFDFTSYPVDCTGYFNIITRFGPGVSALDNEPVFCIADLYLEEHPPVSPELFGKGEGVSFKGGPGNLPMRVERADEQDGIIRVWTTGCLFSFDTTGDIVRTEQRIRTPRRVGDWKFSLPLAGLKVIELNDRECILANDVMNIGIQCDSLMMLAPRKELDATLTSRFGGKWNRFFRGHLFAVDDFGGIAVNPAIPLGSGRVARSMVLTKQLDFADKYNDVNFISRAHEGWRISWRLSPGERLGVSVFPPRPFDWKKSFEMNYALLFPAGGVKQLEKLKGMINVGVLWESVYKGVWAGGGECDPPYQLIDGREELVEYRKAVEEKGIIPIIYMSPRFFMSDDMECFIEEVKRLRDLLGLRGVYYDGNPNDWVKAYTVMRMTRELFPDGVVILHTTGKYYNGGTPASMPDISMPCVDTYADITLRGESVPGARLDWPYVKYVTAQYNVANCIGILKPDKWNGVDETTAFLIALKYNGRGRIASEPVGFSNIYYPIFSRLKKLWEEKGDDPDFFEKYYLPEYEKLVRTLIKAPQTP